MSAEAFREELSRYVDPLRPLLLSFVESQISAETFEDRFFAIFQGLSGLPSDAVSAEADRLFFDVEDFVGAGEVDDEVEYSDPEELRRRVQRFVQVAGLR